MFNKMKIQNSPKTKDATKSAALKPSRPYTEYNIFFQLEREYILQVLLGLQPDVDARRVFDPTREDYVGPDLPARYRGIILLNDWHIPGKNRRRNRQHTKSHGTKHVNSYVNGTILPLIVVYVAN